MNYRKLLRSFICLLFTQLMAAVEAHLVDGETNN